SSDSTVSMRAKSAIFSRTSLSLCSARLLEFVKEHLSFTGEDSPMANLMLSVMGAFAEFERALIRERQREGIALAKQRGAYRGRKKSLSSERIAELRQRVEAGEQKTKLAREFGISRETLYQYLRTDQ
ncbi:helix-turn-helix domain-containing protein, partial [Enterobacter ludwigii]